MIVTCPSRWVSTGVRSGPGVAIVGPLSLGLLSFDEAFSK